MVFIRALLLFRLPCRINQSAYSKNTWQIVQEALICKILQRKGYPHLCGMFGIVLQSHFQQWFVIVRKKKCFHAWICFCSHILHNKGFMTWKHAAFYSIQVCGIHHVSILVILSGCEILFASCCYGYMAQFWRPFATPSLFKRRSIIYCTFEWYHLNAEKMPT